MPTYNRRRFIPHAINYFLRQDYENKELIIIDDGTDNIRDLIPINSSIHYYLLENKITLGAKLNMACEYANGSVIANWDDDDWYAPWRLNYQVNALKNDSIQVCGINTLLYFDIDKKTGFKYVYPPNQKVWLLGSSLCFKKELWKKNKFANINVGMDGLFVWATPKQQVKVLDNFTFSVHTIHECNVSPKKTSGAWWHPHPVSDIASLVNDGWHIYSNGNLNQTTKEKYTNSIKNDFVSQLSNKQSSLASTKNVFACLVHENEECIIDLVRNLRFNDPNSIILLYNGGKNPYLFKSISLLKKSGVIFYPNPHPFKHGYLHDFALECMLFAVNNFSFDILTIVDSDQLLIRKGYSDYVGNFLKNNRDAGILTCEVKKMSADNNSNWVALQGFKEYELWKPFLKQFPEGEKHFLYWTFWPSTIFQANAVYDLLKLFKENKVLQSIMMQTKIWAAEEIIFPTLVKLLGYNIAQNPCSYEFVRYKNKITADEAKSAFNKSDAYWLHPVERLTNSPARKTIREHFCNY